jgi:glyoxalase family protein
MDLQLGGLHHVSAITGDVAKNLDFYTRVLGLRLVKKTVNQDDVSAYHLFYGDALGHPGTELTFFDFPDAAPNVPGAGTISAIAFWLPDRSAVAWWVERFDRLGVAHGDVGERLGRATLTFVDPEGQSLELVAPREAEAVPTANTPWENSPVPAERQIRGLHAVRIVVGRGDQTILALTELLGFRAAGKYTLPPDRTESDRQIHVFEVGPGGLGAEIHVEVHPELSRGYAGVGGVHHVAFRTPNPEEHQAWQREVAASGLHVTPVIDRYYFKSIYFREPSGVLYEIATDGPGFATDEDAAHLGERLALPPFLEPARARIEAGLRPIGVPPVAAGRGAVNAPR